jgi:shikimate kinase
LSGAGRLVSLIGMPGGGKTTAGKELARRRGNLFVDSDKEIELRTGCSIASLFERDGEAAFRDLEAATLARLVDSDCGVIATGGGAVLRAENRELLHRRTFCVYLHASPEFLWRRLRRDRRRPLLQVADPRERLREMSAAREPLYRETAHIVVDINDLPLQRLVDDILRQVDPERMQ